MLLSLSILLIMLPFLAFIYDSLHTEDYFDEQSARLFFQLMADEINQSKKVDILNNEITLEKFNKDTVTITRYKDVIRRQVLGAGHEILLRNIQQFDVEELPYGIKVKIVSLEGATYDKTFNFP
ncbi:ComGF family competence protein [Sediminibacillus albus]|nr:ComGF family competence protein [Sediminibacillus albus]